MTPDQRRVMFLLACPLVREEFLRVDWWARLLKGGRDIYLDKWQVRRGARPPESVPYSERIGSKLVVSTPADCRYCTLPQWVLDEVPRPLTPDQRKVLFLLAFPNVRAEWLRDDWWDCLRLEHADALVPGNGGYPEKVGFVPYGGRHGTSFGGQHLGWRPIPGVLLRELYLQGEEE